MTSYAALKKARDARKSKRRAPNSTLPAVAPRNQSRKKKLGGPRRKQLPARKSSLKKVNRKRRVSEFARAYGSKERVAWVRTLPCVVPTPQCDGPVENAHVRNGGMGRKADARWIIPLCRAHHRFLHDIGPRHFEAYYGGYISLVEWALNTEARWNEFLARRRDYRRKTG